MITWQSLTKPVSEVLRRAGCCPARSGSSGYLRDRLGVGSIRAVRASGFTLVEVLATVLLMAIVIPVVDRGLFAATQAAGNARHRTEAAGLAQSKLSELTVNALWQNGNLSGNFGPDWPEYTWQAKVEAWTGDTQEVGLQQLDVQVLWTARNKQESVTVSGLVYVRPQPSS